MQASVLTLVRGRRSHLINLMHGLSRQTVRPTELVIAWMQPEPHAGLPDPGCPVRYVHVESGPLPLAAARNRAAEAAQSPLLIFLDVDCVPCPTLVEAYLNASRRADGLYFGEVLYLSPNAIAERPDFDTLDRLGIAHPSKPRPPDVGVRRELEVGQLWGLSFALPRQRYRDIGGMDEAFVGYGGEETDFAARLGATGLPFFWTAAARSYHQHHEVAVPPLRHFESILRNAELFHARHGRWCMDYWLGQFRDLGLIDWQNDAAHVTRLRAPTAEEIASSEADKQRLFS